MVTTLGSLAPAASTIPDYHLFLWNASTISHEESTWSSFSEGRGGHGRRLVEPSLETRWT
ncbi:hypothetical protein E2562_000854 [Oryza meyeriana var. granulata]|uniref:Uncharacterized protein n=1 Tax=Oryza meyeriana var. granulata TaxID=110450 RepID=A0A6G1CYQ0_9ORYZ|nr:hypothetical protein E2562_000854 [Oryza meyeriana var. granulata]